MTLREFFRKARRGHSWSLTDWGEVRCANGRCPLGAVDDDLAPVPSYKGAAQMLGLSVSDARKIANAADRPHDKHRPWLLENLGIAP